MKKNDVKFFIGVKALIINQKNQVLVLKSGPAELKSTRRKRPFWDLPGGKMKEGENVEQTLRREVSEELGVERNLLQILNIFDASVSNIKIAHGKQIPLMLITYRCKLPTKKYYLTDEHVKSEWVSIPKAARLLSNKFNKTFIGKLESLNAN
jgi:8-oxo-dGTP diphosphatase